MVLSPRLGPTSLCRGERHRTGRGFNLSRSSAGCSTDGEKIALEHAEALDIIEMAAFLASEKALELSISNPFQGFTLAFLDEVIEQGDSRRALDSGQ